MTQYLVEGKFITNVPANNSWGGVIVANVSAQCDTREKADLLVAAFEATGFVDVLVYDLR